MNITLISLPQAFLSLSLAILYMVLCSFPNSIWGLIAVPATVWFYIILPILLTLSGGYFIYQSIKCRAIERKGLVYFKLNLVSYLIFILTINEGNLIII